jgi:hypothetical protein
MVMSGRPCPAPSLARHPTDNIMKNLTTDTLIPAAWLLPRGRRSSRFIIVAAALCRVVSGGSEAAVGTVNTAAMANVPDAALSLVEALAYFNGSLGRALSPEEALLVTGPLGVGDRIHFAIPGAGPHLLPVPPGGLRVRRGGLTIDGYTQPGASACTRPADEPNDAVLRVVLDGRTGNHTGQPEDGEGRILVINAPDVTIRGLSVLSVHTTAEGGENYGIGWGAEGARGRISGCWIGVHPDAATVAGGEVGVSAFETDGGHLVGTDADGIDDAAERNVIAGFNVQTMVEDATECVIAGNFLGVMPDGRRTIPQEVEDLVTEGDAVGGGNLDGLVVGSPAVGALRPAAMNIIGGQKDEVVQFYYGANRRVVIRGNRCGLGTDGRTPLPSGRFYNPSAADVLITDNVLAHHSRPLINLRGRVVHRRNIMTGNADLFTGEDLSLLAAETGDPRPAPHVDPLLAGAGRLRATLPLPADPSLTPLIVEVSWSPLAETPPQSRLHLLTFADNGLLDADPALGAVDAALSAAGLPSMGPGVLLVTATAVASDGSGSTSVFSEPVAFNLPSPILEIARVGGDVRVSWSGTGWELESSTDPAGGAWEAVSGSSPLLVPPTAARRFFRLRLR